MKNTRSQSTCERRCLVEGLEIRENSDGSAVLVGRAAPFMPAQSVDLGGFIEQIDPGAFTRTLKEGPDTVALVGHDINQPLARRSAETLRLSVNKEGLDFELDVPNTTRGKDLLEDVRNGTINGVSIGFNAREDAWKEPEEAGGLALRTLLDVDLPEISPTAFAAYPDTSVAKRSLASYRGKSGGCGCGETRGANLAAELDGLIEDLVDDDTTKGEVLDDLGSAAGISGSTVSQILAGEIDCPPLNRLEGFANFLGVSVDRLVSAAEADGCDYGDEDERSRKLAEVRKLQRLKDQQTQAEAL
jgi:HK97 family phage prohead protease